MTIKELKEQVNAIPKEYDNIEIFQSIDEEGNGFFPFDGISVDYVREQDDNYRPDCMYIPYLEGLEDFEGNEIDDEAKVTDEILKHNGYVRVAVA